MEGNRKRAAISQYSSEPRIYIRALYIWCERNTSIISSMNSLNDIAKTILRNTKRRQEDNLK